MTILPDNCAESGVMEEKIHIAETIVLASESVYKKRWKEKGTSLWNALRAEGEVNGWRDNQASLVKNIQIIQ